MKPNRKIFGRNTRSTVLELKYLAGGITNIIKRINLVENKKVMDVKDNLKFHGNEASNTTRLCKTVGVEGFNMIVTMDYWIEICGVLNYLENNFYFVTLVCLIQSIQ